MIDVDEETVKWMVVKLEKCSNCRSQVRHNVGDHYPNGVEEQIKDCLRSKLITTI
jgi:hypothetical protein